MIMALRLTVSKIRGQMSEVRSHWNDYYWSNLNEHFNNYILFDLKPKVKVIRGQKVNRFCK